MARGEWTLEELVEGVRAADRRALARAISLVEDGDPLAYPLVREVYPHTGRAAVVGFTTGACERRELRIAAQDVVGRGCERAVNVLCQAAGGGEQAPQGDRDADLPRLC